MAFEFKSRIRYSETDPNKALTLVALADYFQDASTFQSEDRGVGMEYLQEQELAWMILSWQIEIERRPKLAEHVTVQTWPYGFKAFYGYRNYAMLDADGICLAKANSIWALIDMKTGKPVRVSDELISGYVMEPKLEMAYTSRKIQVPEESVAQEPFLVCRYHLDSNRHVNNGQYIRMAEEFLPAGFETKRMAVEYRQQARLHDRITPFVHQEENQVIVSLCNDAGKPYAVLAYET